MHKSGISSISASAVQLFFILKKITPLSTWYTALLWFSGLSDSLDSLVVCTGKCKTDTNP